MLKDILRGTPAYQYIYEEGREEEHQKHLRSLQQKILEIIQKRYPRLAKLAQKQVVGIVQTELLEDLLIKVAMAHPRKKRRKMPSYPVMISKIS